MPLLGGKGWLGDDVSLEVVELNWRVGLLGLVAKEGLMLLSCLARFGYH